MGRKHDALATPEVFSSVSCTPTRLLPPRAQQILPPNLRHLILTTQSSKRLRRHALAICSSVKKEPYTEGEWLLLKYIAASWQGCEASAPRSHGQKTRCPLLGLTQNCHVVSPCPDCHRSSVQPSLLNQPTTDSSVRRREGIVEPQINIGAPGTGCQAVVLRAYIFADFPVALSLIAKGLHQRFG